MRCMFHTDQGAHRGIHRILAPLWIYGVLFVLLGLPSIGFAEGKLSFQDILKEDKLNVLKKEKKIEHSDVVVSALLLMAEGSLRKGNRPEAIAYAERAARFSPESPFPHFFLSQAIAFTNRETFVRSMTEYATALRLSWNDFSLLSASLGTIGLAFVSAIFLGIFTFLIYVYVLYFPWWVHYFHERLPPLIHPYVLGGVLLFIVYGLFRILPPFWFFMIHLLALWFFYRKAEKQATILCLGGLLFASLVFSFAWGLLTLHQSPFARQMIKNQKAEFEGIAPLRADPIETSSWRIPFIEASHRMQEHDWKGAEQRYQQALLKNPESALILNNIGNVYFYQNHFDQALQYYQKVIAVAPENVTAHYNISQVYKEKLLFKEGDEKYRAIEKKAPKRVKAYSDLTAAYPAYPVIEERFTKKDLWQTGLAIILQSDTEQRALEQAWYGELSRGQFIILAFFSTMGLMALCVYLSPSISGDCCFICFKATCARCQKKFSTYNMCSECGKELKMAVSKKSNALPKRLYPFFILPGGWQLSLHQPVRALFFMMGFYFLVMLLFFGDLFLSSAQGHLSIEKSLLLWVVLLGVYFLSMYDFFSRRKEMGWSSKAL